MSEKNEEIKVNEASESTIFSDPEHFADSTDTKKRGKSRLYIRFLASFLAVAILATATFLAFKYIPELTEKNEENKTITVTNTAETAVEYLTVKNNSGTLKLNAKLSETDGESTVAWTVDGVDSTLTSTTRISSFAKGVISLSALEKLSADGTDFGFSTPKATVTVKTADSEYALLVGNAAPADLGYYCKLSIDEGNVYIIDNATAVSFMSAADTDFGDTTGFVSIKSNKNASCFNDTVIVDFDYIKVSGKKHETPFEIVAQDDEKINAYFAFKMVKPMTRICDSTTAETILSAFSSGFSVDGVYAYSVDSTTLKKYGLDNPDYVVTLSLAGEAHTLKFSVVDESYAAFIDGKTGMVQKISLSSIPFATAKIESYYSTFIILENLSGLKQMKVESGSGNFVFDIEYTEDAEEDFFISFGGTKLDTKRFKDYYGTLIGMTPISFETANVKDVDVKITFVHSDSINDTVLTFKKCSELRYLAEIDGCQVGQVTSTALDKFISDTEKTANGNY